MIPDDPDPPPKIGLRPRAAEPLAPVTTWLPPRVLDRLLHLAQSHDESVSATMRRIVTVRLPRHGE